MSNETSNGFVDQLGRGLGGLFRFVVRLIFILFLAILLGGGIYYGIAYGLPALDRAYIQPVRDNTVDIASLQTRQQLAAEQNEALITALQERITALEVENDTTRSSLAELQTQYEGLIALADQQELLAEQLAMLDSKLDSLDSELNTLIAANSSQLAELDEKVLDNQTTIKAVVEDLATEDFPIEQAYADLQLVKSMALITRAQMYIFQANFGLAQQDIETARDLLVTVDSDPALAGLDITPILTRLSLALGGLASNPEQAASDLDVAWEILVAGIEIAEAEPVEEETSTP